MEFQEQLVGAWQLKNFTLKNLTLREDHHPLGKSPVGQLLFTNDHYMSVNIMAYQRPFFQYGSMQSATEDEKIMACESYFAYSGKWRIVADKIFVKVETSLIPNWTGKEHERIFKLSDTKLGIFTPEMIIDGNSIVAELIWTR